MTPKALGRRGDGGNGLARDVWCARGDSKLASANEEVNRGGDGLRMPLIATVLAACPKQGLWPTTKTVKSFQRERVTRMSPRGPDPHLVQMLRVMVLLASAGFLATDRSRRICGVFGSWFRRKAGMGQDWGRKVTGVGVILLTRVRGWCYSDPEVELLAGNFVFFDLGMIHCHYLGG